MKPKLLHGWRGWVVVILVSVQFALALGPAFNYSIFLLSFQAEFHTSTAITGWIGSIAHALLSLGTLPALLLLRRLSPRVVTLAGIILNCGGYFTTAFIPSLGFAFLTYGVAVGLGISFIMQAGVTLSLDWYPKKYCARAYGVLTIGTSCGVLISGPLLNTLISAYGWRHAFMVVSGGIFVVSATSALFLTNPPPKMHSQCQKEDQTASEAQTSPSQLPESDDKLQSDSANNSHRAVSPWYRLRDTWLWFAGICVGALASTFLAVCWASFMDSIGLTVDDISLAIVVLSLGDIFGKILISAFGDSLPFMKLYIIAWSFILGGVLSGFLTLVKTSAPTITLSFLLGMARACFYGALVTSAMEIFHAYGVGVASALSFVPFGLGVLISAPLSGGLYDLTGDYNLSLLILAALLAFSTVCLLLIPIKRKIRARCMRNLKTNTRQDVGCQVTVEASSFPPNEGNSSVECSCDKCTSSATNPIFSSDLVDPQQDSGDKTPARNNTQEGSKPQSPNGEVDIEGCEVELN